MTVRRREFLAGATLPLLGATRSWTLGFPTAPPGEPAAAPLPRLRPVSYRQVRLRDSFWAPRQRINREATVPHLFRELERAGHVSNFERAAARAKEGYRGPVYMDSDLYKSLDAAAYVLGLEPNAGIAEHVDKLAALIRAAQQPDGYVNTCYQVKGRTRFSNLRDDHELYCAGHLIEAAVTHHQATGSRALLDPALRYADLIDRTFGKGPGQRGGYCGHPEIELALIRLAGHTGDRRYYDLARFFVEQRGTKQFAVEHGVPLDRYDGTYFLDQCRIREHTAIAGHAVRAGYLFCAASDLAAETGDLEMLAMLDRVWQSATERRSFVTGGMGSSHHNEGFTSDYDLPTYGAYQESCATISLAMLAHRLGLLHGDARYIDVAERALYNAVLAGVSLDGTRFFYVNPLASMGTHHREPWYDTACCPPNLARIVAGLGGYAYATAERDVYVNLFVQGTADTGLARLEVMTEYPWDGRITITLREPKTSSFALRVRVPGWSAGDVVSRVNGQPSTDAARERGYLVLRRTWKDGDRVEVELPMPVRRLEAHPLVAEAAGRVALARGPIVYCIEQCDQQAPVSTLVVPAGEELRLGPAEPRLLGARTLTGTARSLEGASSEDLYREQRPRQPRSVPIKAVPYGFWDNREPGPMQVWILAG
jgi:hypothetical protein